MLPWVRVRSRSRPSRKRVLQRRLRSRSISIREAKASKRVFLRSVAAKRCAPLLKALSKGVWFWRPPGWAAAGQQGSGVMRDEPERDRQQEEFLHHFVDLTSRVAHEFNNVLNSILLQLALFEQRGLTPQAHPELATIRRMSNGAAAMIKQLQQLIHKQHAPLQAVDLHAVVDEAVRGWQRQN